MARTSELESDRAYRQLRDMILTLELAPGQVMSEAELSARLRIGRTPLRDAIRRLALEDLVTVLPRRGSIVSTIRLDDLQNIFELRLALETLSVRLAAQRMTAEELGFLEELVERAHGLGDDLKEHMELDRTLHLTIARSTKNDYLLRAVERMVNLSLRLIFLSGSRMDRSEEIVHEYEAIVDALRRRDEEAAVRAMETHLRSFADKVRRAVM